MDTGAAFSILPHHSSDPATGQGLVGPSGSPIRCWGESAVKLKLAGQHFSWSFLIADVSTAILGIDFLRAHNLMVYPANCRLVQAGGRVFPTTAVTSGPTASVITGAALLTSRPASAAAGVKLPFGLPAAALSVGRETSSISTPGPVASQQAGIPSVTSAALERAASAAADINCPPGCPLPPQAQAERPNLLHPLLLRISRWAFLQQLWLLASGTPFPRSDLFLLANFPCFSSSFSSASKMW